MARFRELKSELNLLQRADGSARLTQGATSVLCAVYGPVEVKMSKEQCDRATLDVVVKPESGNSGPSERYLEKLITSTCASIIRTDLHPHTAISITLQIENSAGSLLSVLLNATCLALMDACIPLTSVFSAVTCGILESSEMLVDPDMQQEQTCQSLLTFVVEGSADSILTSHANGSFSIEQLQQSLGVAKDCSKSITTFYKEAINRKLSKDAKFAHYFSTEK